MRARLLRDFSATSLSLLICLFFISAMAFAQSDNERQRDIMLDGVSDFNVATGDCTVGGGTSSYTTGYNLDYKGQPILNDAQIGAVEANQPFYERSAQAVGIPWQIIAVVHLREHGLQRSGHSNGQGPYQDYNRNNIPPSLKSGSNWKTGPYTDEEFQTATDWAANDLKQRAGDRDLNNPDNVKFLFFSYNGQAGVYKTQAIDLGFTQEQANNGEGSPYVMNRADAQRDSTDPTTATSKTWGQIKTDGGSIQYPANKDYGAFVVFAGLGGVSGSSGFGNCESIAPNASVGALQDVVKRFAWSRDEQTAKGSTRVMEKKPDYQEAVNRSTYKGGCNGVDCGAFVYIVMHESGWDTNFNPGKLPTSTLYDWLDNPSNGWEVVENYKNVNPANVDISKLRPGDIFIRRGHIYLFVGDIDGFGSQFAAASLCRYAPKAGGHPDKVGGYAVFRKKGV